MSGLSLVGKRVSGLAIVLYSHVHVLSGHVLIHPVDRSLRDRSTPSGLTTLPSSILTEIKNRGVTDAMPVLR
jgi:hypothetical protein